MRKDPSYCNRSRLCALLSPTTKYQYEPSSGSSNASPEAKSQVTNQGSVEGNAPTETEDTKPIAEVPIPSQIAANSSDAGSLRTVYSGSDPQDLTPSTSTDTGESERALREDPTYVYPSTPTPDTSPDTKPKRGNKKKKVTKAGKRGQTRVPKPKATGTTGDVNQFAALREESDDDSPATGTQDFQKARSS